MVVEFCVKCINESLDIKLQRLPRSDSNTQNYGFKCGSENFRKRLINIQGLQVGLKMLFLVVRLVISSAAFI